MLRICLSFLIAIVSYHCLAQGSNGLVAHWDFNGNTNDVSGNGHNGTNNGAVLAPGFIGVPNTAYRFNGTSSHIAVPYAIDLDLDTFSICTKVKFHDFYQGLCQGNYILTKGTEYSDNFYALILTDGVVNDCNTYDPTVEGFIGAASGYSAFPTTYWSQGGTTPSADTGIWYCVVTTYDGDTCKVYLNGAYVAFMPWTDQYVGPSPDDLSIGYYDNDPAYPYWINATVDDIRLYNRPLSPAEVQLYCDSAGLVAGVNPSGTLQGTAICSGQNGLLTFSAITGVAPFTIVFNDGNGNTITAGNVQSGVPFTVNPPPTTTTTYTIQTITDAAGNVTNNPGTAATITVNPTPNAFAGNDTTICKGNTVQLNASGGSVYFWYTPPAGTAPGLSDATIPNPLFNDVTSHTYNLAVTDLSGCSDTDQITITVNPVPAAFAGNDTAICPGVVMLHGAGNGAFSWNPSAGMNNPAAANPSVYVGANTTFTLTVTDPATGCFSTDQVYISMIAGGSFAVTPDSSDICINSSVQFLATGADSYQWFPSTGLSATDVSNPVASPVVPITYYVAFLENTCHTRDTLPVHVTVHAFPVIHATSSNDLDCGHTYAYLAATGALHYGWTPVETLDSPNVATPVAFPDVTTTYTVAGTDAFGCSSVADVTIQVHTDGYGRPQVPSAFTPNGDGLNDCYKLTIQGPVQGYEFHIFNRWGQEVFSTHSQDECWDGRFKGVPCDVGTYVYYYKGTGGYCGKMEGQGSFHLLR